MPVHYAEVTCDTDDVTNIADLHQLAEIENAAEWVNAKYHAEQPSNPTYLSGECNYS